MSEIVQLLLALAQNISLFVLMTVAFSAVQRRMRDQTAAATQLVAGLMFGIAGVIGMASPYHLGDFLIDGRNVVIAVGTVIGGPLAGMICTSLAALYRWHVGGPGMLPALLSIGVTFCISLGFRHYWVTTGRTVTAARLGILGFCAAAANLARYALTLDPANPAPILQTVALPLLILTPAGAYLAGAAALWSQHKEQLQAQIAASNRLLERARDDAIAARQEAERANLQKSGFLASMSHELRTPLNAILGFSEVIKIEQFGPIGTPRYAEYVGMIHDSGRHLLSLINDLLDLSKIEAGRMSLTFETLSAAEVCNRAFETMHPLAASKGVQLSSIVVPGLTILHGDERAVHQILLNLLSNAIKFTEPNGKVDLALSADSRHAVIEVSDSGIGMTPAEMKCALEPYGQANSAQTRRQAGTGLGLPLAKRLAELHGGTLTLTSAPGKGTSVVVTLPWRTGLASPGRTLTAAE